ncbi:MAG: hypothetical protein HQ445_08455, partial [Polaromonas sp.]|nr:hypothetical protein [Polaromonas sp.]
MLDVFTRRWELVLSARSFRWVRRSVWGRGPAQCVSEQHFDQPLKEADRMPALARFLQSSPVKYQPVRISVDDSWVYAAQVTPLVNAERWQDIQAYTAMRMQEIFELSQPLRVVCEPRREGPYWVSALWQSNVDDMRRLLAVHHLGMVACVPQWTVVWNHLAQLSHLSHVAQDDAVLLMHHTSTHLVLMQQGQVVGVKHWPFALNKLPGAELRDLLFQEISRHSMPEPARFGVVGACALPT